MWKPGSSDTLSPHEFKTQIQRFAPRFMGYRYSVIFATFTCVVSFSGRNYFNVQFDFEFPLLSFPKNNYYATLRIGDKQN